MSGRLLDRLPFVNLLSSKTSNKTDENTDVPYQPPEQSPLQVRRNTVQIPWKGSKDDMSLLGTASKLTSLTDGVKSQNVEGHRASLEVPTADFDFMEGVQYSLPRCRSTGTLAATSSTPAPPSLHSQQVETPCDLGIPHVMTQSLSIPTDCYRKSVVNSGTSSKHLLDASQSICKPYIRLDGPVERFNEFMDGSVRLQRRHSCVFLREITSFTSLQIFNTATKVSRTSFCVPTIELSDEGNH